LYPFYDEVKRHKPMIKWRKRARQAAVTILGLFALQGTSHHSKTERFYDARA
jgi:hypothetical protein